MDDDVTILASGYPASSYAPWSHAWTGPAGAGEPVTLADAKAQCKLEPAFTADDALLIGYAVAAREAAERHTGRRLAGREFQRIDLPGFPRDGGPIRLPFGPLDAVDGVLYVPAGLNAQLWLNGYQATPDGNPPLVAPPAGDCWPATRPGLLTAVRVFVRSAVHPCPASVRQAILLTVGHWYAFRGDGGDPERDGLPAAARRLLNLASDGAYR